MNSKIKYGQFYTTNVDYILDRFTKPINENLIEPFVGQGDILKWVDIKETYDIDPKIKAITRDTLLNPPIYNNKFVITNPPYLAKNKNKDKSLYEKYKTDDLYKIFIKNIVDGNVKGGIIIIPSNFLCSNDNKIREYFFSKYKITKLNIFEESVFDDTDIPICSFEFIKKDGNINNMDIMFYPSKYNITESITKDTKWMIGGHLYKKVKSDYKIGRLLKGEKPSTNIKLYATDTGSEHGKIRLEIDKNHYYGKNTDRNIATITTNISIENEQYVVNKFNTLLNKYRKKYHSMFLTNFRNSTKLYTRKRISFYFAYNLITYILENKDTKLSIFD